MESDMDCLIFFPGNLKVHLSSNMSAWTMVKSECCLLTQENKTWKKQKKMCGTELPNDQFVERGWLSC